MNFASLEFIFIFLPVFLLIYVGLPGTARNGVLFFGSLIFYGIGTEWNPLSMGILVGLSLYVWLAALVLQRAKKKERRKGIILFWLLLGILPQLVLLGCFKVCDVPVWPLGLSFVVFQGIGYLTDVYRGDAKADRNLLRSLNFMMMFPALTSGPIVRKSEVDLQLRSGHKVKTYNLIYGIQLFIVGLSYKVLLANHLGHLWDDFLTIGFASVSTPFAWLAAFAYSLRLYFDFCGYSLMAVGIGRMLGYHLPDNFRQPYMALSMTEFWRKWHITLGRWFKDNLYIPLGGNRKGKIRVACNLLVVWTATALWHGTTTNFLIWGGVLFLLICLEKAGLKKVLEKYPVAGHLYMALMIPLTWAVFAVPDLNDLGTYFCRLFPFLYSLPALSGLKEGITVYGGDFLKYGGNYGFGMAAGLLFSTSLPEKLFRKYRRSWWMGLILLTAFAVSVYLLAENGSSTFLYNKF